MAVGGGHRHRMREDGHLEGGRETGGDAIRAIPCKL